MEIIQATWYIRLRNFNSTHSKQRVLGHVQYYRDAAPSPFTRSLTLTLHPLEWWVLYL